jgi:hypothetical protein
VTHRSYAKRPAYHACGLHAVNNWWRITGKAAQHLTITPNTPKTIGLGVRDVTRIDAPQQPDGRPPENASQGNRTRPHSDLYYNPNPTTQPQPAMHACDSGMQADKSGTGYASCHLTGMRLAGHISHAVFSNSAGVYNDTTAPGVSSANAQRRQNQSKKSEAPSAPAPILSDG